MSEEGRLGTGYEAVRDSPMMEVVRWPRLGVECMTTLEDTFSMRRAVSGLGVEGSVRDKELERYKDSKESGERPESAPTGWLWGHRASGGRQRLLVHRDGSQASNELERGEQRVQGKQRDVTFNDRRHRSQIISGRA